MKSRGNLPASKKRKRKSERQTITPDDFYRELCLAVRAAKLAGIPAKALTISYISILEKIYGSRGFNEGSDKFAAAK